MQFGLAGDCYELVGARVAEPLVYHCRAGGADAKHMVVRHASLRDKFKGVGRGAEHIRTIHGLASGQADLLDRRHVGGRLKKLT